MIFPITIAQKILLLDNTSFGVILFTRSSQPDLAGGSRYPAKIVSRLLS